MANPARFLSEYFRNVATNSTSTGTENQHGFGFQATQVDVRNDSTGTDPAGRLYLTLTGTSSSLASTGAGVPVLKAGERLGPMLANVAGLSAVTTSTAVNYRVFAWGGDIV